MKVKRIVADFAVPDPSAAKRFYHDVFGLDVLMDMGWITTYCYRDRALVQISAS